MVFPIGISVLPGCGEDDPGTVSEPRAARGAPEITVLAWAPLTLEAAVDQVAAEAMAPRSISGVSLTILHRGRPLLSGGDGVARVAEGPRGLDDGLPHRLHQQAVQRLHAGDLTEGWRRRSRGSMNPETLPAFLSNMAHIMLQPPRTPVPSGQRPTQSAPWASTRLFERSRLQMCPGTRL